MNAQPSAPSAARAASVASNDALARARDADPRREARRAEDRRKAERRQQWAERRRREPREDELRDVERSVREDTERPRVLQAEPVSVETPIIRLFGNED
jgi:predicted dehydrogenase